MNILYIVNADFENPAFGNAQRTRLLYDALCKMGNVHVFDVRNLRLSPQTGIKKFVNAIWQRLVIKPCGTCLVPVYPFPLHWSVEELFPGIRFDVVVARYLFHVGILSLWNVSCCLYVDIDDHPIQVFDTVYSIKYKLIKRTWSRFINGCLCKFVLRKLAGSWISNPDQVKLVNPYCHCLVLENIPFNQSVKMNLGNCLKTTRLKSSAHEEFIFTVGRMSYMPNYLGVDFFLENIWPVVQAQYTSLKYKIVGHGVPVNLLEKWAKVKNVEILGFVDDLSKMYRECIASVVPVLSGGGTCIKTLESMAHAKICLSTPFGARGLPKDVLQNGCGGVVIYNSAEEFVSAIERIRTDKNWLEKSEKTAANYISENFSQKKFEKTVMELITYSQSQHEV